MLKTTNYKSLTTKETVPVAYAVIDKIMLMKNTATAVFGIYASREESQRFHSVEAKVIRFDWDRKSNLAEQAYNTAKGEGGIFYGWEDAIE
jgi:hypothetical protein